MRPTSFHRIILAASGAAFTATDGETLLAAAERAGIALPSSCRNGTCRTCICRAVQGQVQHLVEWPGLSADEKRDGWLLPCVAVAESDLTLIA